MQHLAYCYALRRTYNDAAAESIASVTAGAFILQKPQGSEKELRSWIFSTARHHCSRYFRQQKKAGKIAGKLKQKMMSSFTSGAVERDEKLYRAYRKALQSLPDEQFATIFLYYNCQRNYQVLHEMMEVSVNALRMRICRIHARIKALTNLNKGMICTKAIVSPELNDVLYKFLTRFKDHLENKTLHKMCYYFSKVDLKEYRESIRIKSVEDYEIALVDSGYDIIVIYWNYIVERKYFGFRFNIENKHLKITVPPQIRQPAVTLENNSDNARKLKKLLHLYPPDKTGKSTIPEELLEALIPPKPD